LTQPLKKEKYTIPAQFDHLVLVRNFIETTGQKYHFSNKVVNSVKLAVEEAITNIIRHGYKDLPPGKIVIKLYIRRFSLTIVLVDQGHSFDPRQVDAPDLKQYVEIGKIGGLGIMMIRKLIDEIDYYSYDGSNNFCLTKYRERANQSRLYHWWQRFKAYSHQFHSYLC
jgi:serine/threonine-protein kinase RsbW